MSPTATETTTAMIRMGTEMLAGISAALITRVRRDASTMPIVPPKAEVAEDSDRNWGRMLPALPLGRDDRHRARAPPDPRDQRGADAREHVGAHPAQRGSGFGG